MIIEEENHLAHYGIIRKSGRYPWGSGGNVPERSKSFLAYIRQMLGLGMTHSEIARGLSTDEEPWTSTDIRAATTLANNAVKQANILMAQRYKDKGYSNTAIGERMGLNESSVRALLKPGETDKANNLQVISSMIKGQVDDKGYIQIGSGVENHIGVSKEKLAVAIAMLKEEGYAVHSVKIDQLGTGNQTTVKVLGPPGSTQRDAWLARGDIKLINEVSDDGGRTFLGMHDPVSINSKRVDIRYAEQGGADADGVIYVRPGIDDISLGGKNYAQVRIAVDGTHYLKGMAMYKDDLPDGVDLQFNTNKSDKGDKLAAMKPMKTDKDGKIDKDNPFGSAISRQIVDTNEDGTFNKVTSVMNIVNEAGDWEEWSRNLSSQMLSKQSPKLAKSQLDMTYDSKRDELDEILKLTNPAVRKKLLESYSDDVDAAAVHLKAAALRGQRTQVILPINAMKDNEIYAPNFDNGDVVALIRYPHGGTFEIPELRVNNKQPVAKKALGNATDAVGINSKVAERLSGADFDGDTVLVIPNKGGKIKTSPALGGLKNFDPQHSYPAVDGDTFKGNKQQLMGDVSNLITDMTIKGANNTELARAVRHSMVVIDAEKHNLNYKQSAIDNGIRQLKERYQGATNAGAATLISLAKGSSRAVLPERVPRSMAKGGPIDPATGELVYENTNRAYTRTKTNKKTGEVTTSTVPRTTKSQNLAVTKDANTLASGTVIEKVYAEHSNRMKALANKARKEMVNTKTTPYSPSAKAAYKTEVARLNAALNVALKNRPLERQAQIIANVTVAAKKHDNPNMDPAELKKLKGQALNAARYRTGAGKEMIVISDREWEAIQAGAVSNNKLSQILSNTKLDDVKKLATPRVNPVMTNAKTLRASNMLASGYTQAEVAKAIGVPLSTLKSSIGR